MHLIHNIADSLDEVDWQTDPDRIPVLHIKASANNRIKSESAIMRLNYYRCVSVISSFNVPE